MTLPPSSDTLEPWAELPKFGYLYFLSNRLKTSVKIGISAGPVKRIRDLRYDVDLASSVMYRFPTYELASATEHLLHQQLAPWRDNEFGTNGGYDNNYKLKNHPGYREWFKMEAIEKAREFLTGRKELLGWWSEIPASQLAYKQTSHPLDTSFQYAARGTFDAERSSRQTMDGKAVFTQFARLKELAGEQIGHIILTQPDAAPDQYRVLIALPNTETVQQELHKAANLRLAFGKRLTIAPFVRMVAMGDYVIVAVPLAEANFMELCRENKWLAQTCLSILNLRNFDLPGALSKILAERFSMPSRQILRSEIGAGPTRPPPGGSQNGQFGFDF